MSNLKIKSYVALDLETTGINPSLDKIIEIGMLKVIDEKVVDSYKTLINPNIHICTRITEITGITDNMVLGKPAISEMIKDILDFIGDLPLLGHNIIFDYSFLKKAAVNSNYTFEKQGIDTLKIARRLLPEVPHKNLEYLCDYFKLDKGSSHRAFDDAQSTIGLYRKLYEIKPDDEGFYTAIPLVFHIKKDVPITEAQKRYLAALLMKHQLDIEEDIEKLTKSMASRMIDKIISEYGK